jgi:hypothetical protein
MQRSRGAERIVWMSLLWTLSSGAAVRGEPPAEAAGQKKAWDQEIAAITDLLIDGSYAPVKERAIRLLEEEEMPDDAVLRVQDLLATAAAKLHEAKSSPAESSPTESSQAEPSPADPEEDIEIPLTKGAAAPKAPAPGKKTAGKDSEPVSGVSFRVRLAEIGSGFAPGSNGVLRLGDDRLELVPVGKKMKGWSILWSDLVAAQADDGMWDSPYPLVITDRDGHKYFVTRIDEQGRYLPGGPILAAIAQSRKKRPAGDGG